jgi:hypothetical protein
MMDIGFVLQPFFEHAALLLAGPNLVAGTLAQIVLAALKAIGFDLAQASAALAKLGFRVSKALLPDLIAAAKAGIKGLTQWFEDKLGSEAEVNEAAVQVLLDQAEPVANAVQQALPDEKEQVAETMQEGLQAYGGATAEIAALYGQALADPAKLATLVAHMQQKATAWANQSIEAKENSLIRHIRQVYRGDQAITQRVSGGSGSTISDVVQDQRTGSAANQVISAGAEEDEPHGSGRPK